jgi:hypothetical protein
MALEKKYIKVNDGSDFMAVNDIYAYRYDCGEGKIVLRIFISADDITFDKCSSIFDRDDLVVKMYITAKVELSEADTVTEDDLEYMYTFEHFNKDYQCAYNKTNNVFAIEITQSSSMEVLTAENATAMDELNAAVVDLYESTIE